MRQSPGEEFVFFSAFKVWSMHTQRDFDATSPHFSDGIVTHTDTKKPKNQSSSVFLAFE